MFLKFHQLKYPEKEKKERKGTKRKEKVEKERAVGAGGSLWLRWRTRGENKRSIHPETERIEVNSFKCCRVFR